MYLKFKNQTIQVQLIVIESIFLIFFLGITILLGTQFTEELNRQARYHSLDLLDEATATINRELRSIDGIATNLALNSNLQDFALLENYAQNYPLYLSVEQYIKLITSLNNYLSDVAIVSNAGTIYFTPYNQEKFDLILTATKELPLSTSLTYIGTDESNTGGMNLMFARNIYNGSFTKALGKIIIFVNYRVLSDRNYASENVYPIIRSESTFNPNVNVADNWYLDIPYKLIHQPKTYYTKDNLTTVAIYIGILLVLLFFMGITYFWVSKAIVFPLTKITNFINEISQGDLRQLKQRLEKKGPSNIVLISESINRFFNEINDLSHRLVRTTSRLYSIELQKQQAELEYLRSQVNPHFLYNTLGIIKGNAALNNNPVIEEISAHLIQMFRYSAKGEIVVPLKEELDICRSYISIQQYRFKHRFDVHYEIEGHLLFHPIQKMLLHPLIENAIIHGVEPTSNHTTITIRCCELDNAIMISVEDNGNGISPEKLVLINQMLESSDSTYSKEHIGIYNLNARLLNYYGETSGLTIVSEPNKATIIRFIIPLSKGGNNE